MKQVTIGENVFQVRKVPAYPDQLLLAKAALPIYQDVIPIITKVLGNRELMVAMRAGTPPKDLVLELMDVVFMGMRRMSEDDLLTLTQRSLRCVEIQQGQGGWSQVMLPDGQLMFNTITLPNILQLIWNAVEVNLGTFFAEALGKSQGVKATAA